MIYAFVSETNELIEYPVSIREIKNKFPNTSFPKPYEDLDLNSFGVRVVTAVPTPEVDYSIEYAVELDPTYVDNAWTQTWQVLPFSAEVIAGRVESAKENVRALRDSLLVASDWTQLVDCPLSAEDKLLWSAYRQSLRDVPEQSGFPAEVVWPEEPS
tara:strand:- start:72 stop:542 length:471 start_codon:yes stop_codon:yes gene_type:complete